ncbi:hypothetical protein PsorP6_013546 [Peronosclerospora sorghi]|uniref:Uncharacterized protein n=1 Tax=Peronosclerospora sorghi TaxID=230839 RepID=A0ACC0VHE3_9STRA|nr:hypothetical protein PsorP6_013546 [Peronosclerospora sorghi]
MRFGVRGEEEAAPSSLASVYSKVSTVQKTRPDAATICTRLRAPSLDSSTASSIDEDDEDSDSSLLGNDSNVYAATSALEMMTLSTRSRQELVKQVERACERKAVLAVTGSEAYQALCETLQRARQDAEAQLQRLDKDQEINFDDVDTLKKQQQLERAAKAKLEQIHSQEKSIFDRVEKELRAFQQAQKEECRRQEKERQRDETRKQHEDEIHKKKLQEVIEKEKAQGAQRKVEQESKEAQAKAKDQADDRAALQIKREIERERVQAEKRNADKAVAAQAENYITSAHECVKRLEALQRETTAILDSPDPTVKKIRMQIRREVGLFFSRLLQCCCIRESRTSRTFRQELATKLQLRLPLLKML